MKRILTLTWLTLFLVCCDFVPRQSSANSTKVSDTYYRVVNMKIYKYGEIEYRVFHQGEGGVFVINHTKELLEIELLKKQLAAE